MLEHANVCIKTCGDHRQAYTHSTANQIRWPNYLWFYYIVSAWAKSYLKAMLFYSIEFCVVVIRAENTPTPNGRCLLFGWLCYYCFVIYSNWIDCAQHLRNWCIPRGAARIVTTFRRCRRPRSCWNQIGTRSGRLEFARKATKNSRKQYIKQMKRNLLLHLKNNIERLLTIDCIQWAALCFVAQTSRADLHNIRIRGRNHIIVPLLLLLMASIPWTCLCLLTYIYTSALILSLSLDLPLIDIGLLSWTYILHINGRAFRCHGVFGASESVKQ